MSRAVEIIRTREVRGPGGRKARHKIAQESTGAEEPEIAKASFVANNALAISGSSAPVLSCAILCRAFLPPGPRTSRVLIISTALLISKFFLTPGLYPRASCSHAPAQLPTHAPSRDLSPRSLSASNSLAADSPRSLHPPHPSLCIQACAPRSQARETSAVPVPDYDSSTLRILRRASPSRFGRASTTTLHSPNSPQAYQATPPSPLTHPSAPPRPILPTTASIVCIPAACLS